MVSIALTKKKWPKIPKPKRSHYLNIMYIAVMIDCLHSFHPELISPCQVIFDIPIIIIYSTVYLTGSFKKFDNNAFFEQNQWMYYAFLTVGICSATLIALDLIKLLN